VGSYDSEQGPVVGSCEHSNECSSSVEGREFLDCLSNFQVLKDSASCSYLVRTLKNQELIYTKLMTSKSDKWQLKQEHLHAL
jgi:hypothetical protein